MAKLDLIQSCVQALHQISDELADAIFYLDAGTAEAFQFVGGISVLLDLGVRAVCSLEDATTLDTAVNWQGAFEDPVLKLVIMTSHLLSDTHRYILRCLNIHRSVLQCTIFTSISENAHAAHVDAPFGPDAFQEYESLLLQDYQELLLKYDSTHREMEGRDLEKSPKISQGLQETFTMGMVDNIWRSENEEQSFSSEVGSSKKTSDNCNTVKENLTNLRVSVRHFPMVFCPLTPHAFVMPSESAVAEARLSDKFENSFCPGLPPIGKVASDGEDIPGAMLTAHFLHHLANQMDLKLEIFSLGPLSHVIGNMLTNLSSLYDVGGRTKRSTGLILIDRSLDLVTPCCHGDSLLDRMFTALPRRQRSIISQYPLDASLKRVNSCIQHPAVDVRVPLESILKVDSHADQVVSFPAEAAKAFLSGLKGIQNPMEDAENNRSLLHNLSSRPDLLYSSIGSSGYFKGIHCLEALIERHVKDGVLLIKKWLQEALRQERVSFKNHFGAVTPAVLHSLLDVLTSKPEFIVKYEAVIQLAKAVELALHESSSMRWEAFASAERILMLSAGDTSQSLSSQIEDLVNQSVIWRTQNHGKSIERPPGLLSIRDVLILSIVGYSLAGENFGSSGSMGPFSWEEEHALKEAIIDAIVECCPGENISFLHGLEASLEAHWERQKSSNVDTTKQDELHNKHLGSIDFDDQWGSWEEEDETNIEPEYGELQLKLELRDRLDNVFKVLHKVSDARRSIPFKNKHSYLEEMSGTLYTNNGLVSRILHMIFSKFEIPGLEYHSSTVGRLLKSGFGRFGLVQAKPRLEEQSVLFVFVVGGINTEEIKEVQEVLSLFDVHGEDLLIGGTTILTPDDMFEMLLGSSSYFSSA